MLRYYQFTFHDDNDVLLLWLSFILPFNLYVGLVWSLLFFVFHPSLFFILQQPFEYENMQVLLRDGEEEETGVFVCHCVHCQHIIITTITIIIIIIVIII